MRLLGAILRLTGPLLFLGGNHPSMPAAASRPAIFHAAERLCVQQGGAFTLSVDGESFTCMAPDDATFSRRDMVDGKSLCESTGGEWVEVLGIWYTCELPD